MVYTNKRVIYGFHYLMPLIAFAVLMLAGLANAAETGRVELDGREVILFDDNTWRFASDTDTDLSSANDDCVEIKSKALPVSICLDESVWKLGDGDGPGEFSFTTKDNNLFLLMITEKAEIPLKAFEKAIVANAQKASGLRPVEVIKKERIDALGVEWGRMVYNADIDGLIIKYENFFTTLKDKGSVQFVFYTTPNNYEAASREIDRATKKIVIR